MSASPDPQTSIYERIIEDDDLVAALEERQKAKEKAATANKAYREAHDVVKGKITELDLGQDAAVRAGRFVLTNKATAARTVNFETAAGQRLQISLLDAA